MGVVFRAFDTLLNRAVAIKVLNNPDLEETGRQRILHEAQATARLNHPNIVNIFDTGASPQGEPFIIMELLEGKSLRQYARMADLEGQPSSAERLSIGEICRLAGQICTALEHAHQAGIIHRDLKPDNILVVRSAKQSKRVHDLAVTLKLMDFGLARNQTAPMLTQKGAIMGSFYYMAPELLMGQTASPQSDLYALGVILYEMIAGCLPFSGSNLMTVLSQHLHASPIPPSSFNPEIPPQLETLILRLMEKQPGQRHNSALDILEVIEEIITPQVTGRKFVELPGAGDGLSLLDRIVRGRIISREDEMAAAANLWKKASAGEGSVLLISGEPGIGKSRLARELITWAGLERAVTLVGECYSEDGAPFALLSAPIQQALEHLAKPQRVPDDYPMLPQHLADLISLAPGLRLRYPNISPNPKLDPQSELQRIYESVAALFSLLSKKQAVLLLLEDVHWADSSSLALLRHLARRLCTEHILVVLTYRELELDKALPLNDLLLYLNRERLASRIKLNRFSKEQTKELLGIMFTEEISPEFLEGIYLETEGNPFYVEEVCHALVESGQVYFSEGRWHRPAKMDQLVIPQSVRLAIQSRVDKLPAQAQDLLKLAALLGREFEYEALLQVCEFDEDTLISALENAERGLLIQEVSIGKGVTYSFTHALIPAALQESISGPRRRLFHQRVAQVLTNLQPEAYDRLALHFAQAGERLKASEYYRKAAQRASELFAFDVAVKHLEKALDQRDESQPAENQAGIYEELADAQVHLGLNTQAIPNYQEALRIHQKVSGEKNISALRLHRKIVNAVIRTVWFADRDKYRRTAEESLAAAIRLAEGQPPSQEEALFLQTWARFEKTLRKPPDLEAAQRAAERTVEVAEVLDDPVILASALGELVIILSGRSSSEERLAIARRMLDLSCQERFNNLSERITVFLNYGYVLKDFGEYRQALEYFKDAENLAVEIQAVSQHAGAIRGQVECFYHLDEWDLLLEAVARYHSLEKRYVNFSQRSGPRYYLSALSGSVYAMRGDLEKSKELSEESRAIMTAVTGPREIWDRSNLY